MKTYRHFLMLLLLMNSLSVLAFDYSYKGVTFSFKLKGNDAIITKFDRNAKNVVVPSTVVCNGKSYPVKEISTFSNGDNYSARTLVLEEGIERIANWSFMEFRWLESVTLPSTLTYVGKKAFRNNKETTFSMPAYISEERVRQGQELKLNGNAMPVANVADDDNASVRFSTFANNKLKRRMEQWQTKKEYESVEQYKARVTDQRRRERMNEYVEELKEEFVARYAPTSIETSLGDYDSDYGVFTVRTATFGNIYAQVPKADSRMFRQNWQSVVVSPHYGVRDDTLSIVSCDFMLNGKTYAYAKKYDDVGDSDYHFDLPPLDIDLAAAVTENPKHSKRMRVDRTIDTDIPLTNAVNNKTFVLIIGNENYKRIAKVPYANNDARVFAEYCQKTLGIPQNNIQVYKDATVNDMRHAVQVLSNKLQAYKGEASALVYYSGHGYPDEATRMPYLMPVDGFATDVKTTGYSLNDVYDELAAAPSKLTMFLLDACVAMAARSTIPEGNMLVFSASQGTETAFVDEEHGHGRFTYFLLKHLRETKGNTTIGSLVDYVKDEVLKASVSQNDGKKQTPLSSPSPRLGDSWKNLRLR
mgnify:CR=1 FL=1